MQRRDKAQFNARDEALAGANGFFNAVTLGTDDYYDAVVGAALGQGAGRSFWDRYSATLAHNKDLDAYYARRYPLAHYAGLATGTGLLILASDGIATPELGARLAPQTIRLAGSAVPRMAQSARATGVAMGVGAGMGVAGQLAASSAQWRLSTGPELAGAAAGGALAGPATLARGPGTGAAVESLVNHAVQSALQRKPMNWPATLRDTSYGAIFGLVGGHIAAKVSDGLTPVQKGDLGDALSAAKSRILGDEIVIRHKSLPGGGRTIADFHLKGATPEKPRGVEAKFGFKARLSDAQKYALSVLGPQGRYYVDHSLPPDIAKGVGGLLGIGVGQAKSARKGTS